MQTAANADSASRLILVRHTEVAERYRRICYGQSDVDLSERGKAESESLGNEFAAVNPAVIFHSRLTRTRLLAEIIAHRTGAPLNACDAIRERNFGDWELRTWDQIHERNRGDLDRLVSEPDGFRPPGGETTYEMRDRVVAWFNSLPPVELIVAVTHGGPIAVLLGHLESLPVQQWACRIPATGEAICIDRTTHRWYPFAGAPIGFGGV